MSMKMRIRVNNLQKALAEKEDAVNRALEQIGMQAEKYAKGNAPVDTGRLKGSITYAAPTQKSSPEAPASGEDGVSGTKPHAVTIGTNVSYAKYVELGAQKRSPKHFLKRAMMDHLSEYEKIIKQELDKPDI